MTAEIHELLEKGDNEIVGSELKSIMHRTRARYAAVVDIDDGTTIAHAGQRSEGGELRRQRIDVQGRWRLAVEIEPGEPVEDEAALAHSLRSSATYLGALFRAIAMEVAAGHRRSIPPPHLTVVPPEPTIVKRRS